MPGRYEPILLVEDSIDDYEATVRAFKKAELVNPLVHAGSGERALEYLRSATKPCLILLDLNMPGMGGKKFLEKIRRESSFKEIPVVILTTSNYEPDIKECYALGANAYILKSADFNVLALAIKRLKEYWLDTVVLPIIFDREDDPKGEGHKANVRTSFSVTNNPGQQADHHAVHLSPEHVREKIIGRVSYKPLSEKDKLTHSEIETLTWVARGKGRWEIGVILGVSEDTVKARLEKCRQKLGASNTTHAIAIALLHGLLS